MISRDQDSAFLGIGWGFPPTFNRFTRGVEMVEAEEDIRQSIRLILSVTPGERPMLPPFGCDLTQFVFTPIDTSVETMIETVVRKALLDYEPRITIDRVAVTTSGETADRAVLVTIDYLVRTTNKRYNLVYPYYLNEYTGIPR